MFCTNCGTNNTDDSNYCINCGLLLEKANHSTSSEDIDVSIVNEYHTETVIADAVVNEYSASSIAVENSKKNKKFVIPIVSGVILMLVIGLIVYGMFSNIGHKYYKEYSAVPNLGTMIGAEPTYSKYTSEDGAVYSYSIMSIEDEDITKYKDLLSENGFYQYNSDELDDGSPYASFINRNKNTLVAITLKGNQLIIYMDDLEKFMK